jgi:glycosyltransferase involved in cell wall biosynthesis
MSNTLHVLSLSSLAGLEVMFLNYLRYMKNIDPIKFKHQYIFAINLSEVLREELDQLQVTYYVAHRKNRYDLSIIKQISDIIKNENIRNVYGQNFTGNFWASLACFFKSNVKLVCHEHGTVWNSGILTNLLSMFWVHKSSVIICTSKATKVILKEKYYAPNKKLRIVYNGVPIVYENNIKKEKERILFVGRLESIKAPEIILQALPYLIKRLPQIKLDLVGEGELEENLKCLAKTLKIESSINFIGRVTNVSEYMARSILLILPSVSESLGNVIIEAALQGTPTIATYVDGIPEVIINNKTGYLIKPEVPIKKRGLPNLVVNPKTSKLVKPKQIHPETLADAIYKVIVSNSAIQVGENARMYVKQKFDMDRYYHEIINLVE